MTSDRKIVRKVNANGDTIRRERDRSVTSMRKYAGNFEWHDYDCVYNTATGHYDIKAGEYYRYVRDRLGSTVAVTDGAGNLVQATGYYPSGTPYKLPASVATDIDAATEKLHIGNKWIGHKGFDIYDNTARMHDPLLARFHTIDPLFEKYQGNSPWSHCAANPLSHIDPDGCELILRGPHNVEVFDKLKEITEGIKLKLEDDGRLSYELITDAKINRYANCLIEIIENKDISVSVVAQNILDFPEGEYSVGGSYLGNTYNENTQNVTTTQFVVPFILNKIDNATDTNGVALMHEITESYAGGEIALKTKRSSPRPGLDGSTYREAHENAMIKQPFDGLEREFFDRNNNVVSMDSPDAVKIHYFIRTTPLKKETIFAKRIKK